MTDATPTPDRPDAERSGTDRPDEAVPAGADAPTGGDKGTEAQLHADNAAEEDTLRALDPGAPTG